MKRADTYHFLRSLRSTAVLVVATAALLASVLTSCSKQAEEPVPVPHDGQIRIDTEIASSPQGAAPQSASQADNNAGTKAVLTGPVVDGGTGSKATLTDIRLLREDGTAVVTTFTSFATANPQLYADRAASGALTFKTPQYYKKDNSTASYIAVHPAGEIINSVSNDKGLTWEIDGATDVLVSKVYDAGKYSAPASGTTMVLDHHLAQLRVICTADPSVALNVVQAVWGKITKIELVNTHKNYVFYPDRLPNITGGTTPGARTLWNPGYGSQTLNVILGYYTTHCAAGMFVPKSTTDPLTLRVSSTVGAAVEVEVQLNDGSTPKGFEAGKIHTVTLTFGAADKPIAVTSTLITNWEDGGTGSGDGIVFEDVFTPSEGIIDMNYAELVKTGTVSMGQYTATPTRRSYNPNTYAASNADNNGGYEGASNQAIVEPAYYKFEVAKADEAGRMDWATAWAACKKKAPVGAWRLPRIMELVLMGFNKAELEKTPGFTPLDDLPYMSGKEEKASSVWLMRYPFISSGAKTTAYDVRCVRELDVSLPAVEDYYYSDGTFSHKLDPAKTVEGVIYWIDSANPKHFKIVGMDKSDPLNWGPTEASVDATDLDDGKTNTLKCMQHAQAAEHYAAQWCYQKNTGLSGTAAANVTVNTPAYQWYLPAISEAQYLYCAYLGIAPTTWDIYDSQSTLTAAAGYPLAWNARFTKAGADFQKVEYWISFHDSPINVYAWILSLPYNDLSTGAKQQGVFDGVCVRCIREVTLP